MKSMPGKIKSFGLTTMKNRHVELRGATIRFSFSTSAIALEANHAQGAGQRHSRSAASFVDSSIRETIPQGT
jgi:DNA topoisomerase IB